MAIRKCVIPLSEPLDDHRPILKCFEEFDVFGGPRGYRHKVIGIICTRQDTQLCPHSVRCNISISISMINYHLITIRKDRLISTYGKHLIRTWKKYLQEYNTLFKLIKLAHIVQWASSIWKGGKILLSFLVNPTLWPLRFTDEARQFCYMNRNTNIIFVIQRTVMRKLHSYHSKNGRRKILI